MRKEEVGENAKQGVRQVRPGAEKGLKQGVRKGMIRKGTKQGVRQGDRDDDSWLGGDMVLKYNIHSR